MPRSSQDSLIHILLMWLTLLSVIQVAFIIFFFTYGHQDPPKSSITGGPKSTQQPQTLKSTLPPPSGHGLIKGQMFTYKAVEDNGKIKWQARYPSNGFISENEKGLTIQEDGHYFLNLQVTLKTSKCPCNGTRGSECMVKLTVKGRDLLLGWINTQTCSTGLLGKVAVLGRGTTLEIAKMLNYKIDDSEFLTHLDIIMLQPQTIWFIHQGTSPQQHNGCYNAGYGKWCEYLSYLENPQTQRGEGSISGFHRINILRDTLLKHANDAWTHILLFDD